jgi:hypothetical protein
MLPSAKFGAYDPGDARGVPRPWWLPNGEWSACAMSKSSGRARDLIMRSRSSLVNRLSFARLRVVSSVGDIPWPLLTCSGTRLVLVVDLDQESREQGVLGVQRRGEPDGRIRS